MTDAVNAAEVIAKALLAERGARAYVVRLRAIYCRARERMERMPFRDADRLHYRLKDREHAAIAAHQAADGELRRVGGLTLSSEEG